MRRCWRTRKMRWIRGRREGNGIRSVGGKGGIGREEKGSWGGEKWSLIWRYSRGSIKEQYKEKNYSPSLSSNLLFSSHSSSLSSPNFAVSLFFYTLSHLASSCSSCSTPFPPIEYSPIEYFSLSSSSIFSTYVSSSSAFSFFFYYFPFLLILLLLVILFYLCSSSFLLIPITSPSFYLSSSALLFLLLSSRILFVTVFNFFLSSLFEFILLLLLFLLSILTSFSIPFSSSFSFACF